MKALAIIPARGGSKSVPRKNVALVYGKPLIAYTIQVAQMTSLLDRVIVSTDDAEIAAVAKQYGAEVPFMRPHELGQDDTPGILVLQHAVQWLETNENYCPDVIVTLQPTSPLRRPEHIEQAILLGRDTNADSVVSVCLVEHSPYWMMRLDGNRTIPFIEAGLQYTRRQDLPPVYRLNGAVYVTRRDVLVKENKVEGRDTRAIVMDAESSLDIDSWLDLKIAEVILRGRENGDH